MSEITVVTSVRLPIKLHEWAKKRAKAEGRAISNWLRVHLQDIHDQEKRDTVRRGNGD